MKRSLLRRIAALAMLPFAWAGRLVVRLRGPLGPELLKAAWRIGRDDQTGFAALAGIRTLQGVPQAYAQAEAWGPRNSGPSVAAYAGMLAIELGRVEEARQWLDTARGGTDLTGTVDMLALMVAGKSDDKDALRRVAVELSERHDLPPMASRLAWQEVMWGDLLAGRLEAAAGRARRIVAVEDDAQAGIVLWAWHQAHGRTRQAEAALRPAASLRDDLRLYYLSLACAATGRSVEAEEFLKQLRDCNDELAERTEAFMLRKATS
jgi:hypothetical protein